jgi:L-threonylcarbamoyladenylate synthase
MMKRYASHVPNGLEELLAAETQPTTYLLPASRAVAPDLVAPDGTVGLRVVKDEFCFKVVRRLGHGLVSTSANKAGEPTPAAYTEIDAAIMRGADYVVNWRQEDAAPVAPSRVLRLGEGGKLEVVRE